MSQNFIFVLYLLSCNYISQSFQHHYYNFNIAGSNLDSFSGLKLKAANDQKLEASYVYLNELFQKNMLYLFSTTEMNIRKYEWGEAQCNELFDDL